jgi:hypothetical protein
MINLVMLALLLLALFVLPTSDSDLSTDEDAELFRL